jgi:hypothetical protein
MIESFAVISGSIDKEKTKDLDLISNTAKNRYASYKTAHHEWIDKIESGEFRSALDRTRIDPTILKTIQDKYPSSTIKSVTEADEIYWAVSPKGAKGSDRSLVDCHYDAPFALFPNGNVIFYRVIIACNENNTVTTTFPDEDVSVKMNTNDFHGLDYNKDIHCVEGKIPEDKYRVLLKMHYLIIPPGSSEIAEKWVRFINVAWTVVSRETMRMSADPQNIWESIVGSSVNVLRFIFNNFYYFLFIVFVFICIVLYRTKWIKKYVISRFKR